MAASERDYAFPSLPYAGWTETRETLQRYAQLVGKVRLALAPPMNHFWHVPLYVSPRGLRTSPIYVGGAAIELELDLNRHELRADHSELESIALPLGAQPFSDFFGETMSMLEAMGVAPHIWTVPVEVEDRTPFDRDPGHDVYEREQAHRFWRALLQVDRIFKIFRARFIGKASPVHFFWGAFDLATSRFSGRAAPRHGGSPNVPDFVPLEAYSHEVSSCGFWPGGPGLEEAAFYSYVYPEPPGFASRALDVDGAYYHEGLKEHVLPWEVVRTAPDPDDTLLRFLQASYEAGADLGRWDRERLEAVPREGTFAERQTPAASAVGYEIPRPSA